MSVVLSYQAHLVELQASTARLRSAQVFAFAGLVITIGIVLLLAFLVFSRRTVSWPSVMVPVPLATYCAWQRQKQNAALLQTLRLADAYQRGLTRLNGSWPGNGVSGFEFVPGNHVYGKDLHVFGGASLFELLCT